MNHQIVWGVLLFLAGIGVFYRTPTVIEKVKTIEYFSGSGIYFAYFCFYFMGIILVGGGIKKIVNNFKGIKKTIQN